MDPLKGIDGGWLKAGSERVLDVEPRRRERGFGWVADRTGRGFLLLVWIAVGCAVAVAIFVGFSNGAGWQTYLSVFLLGATTLGWNGVHMAELARAADEGAVGEVTSAAVLFGFVGAFAGPLAFVLIAHASGSYAVAFVVVTVPLPLVAIAALYCRPKDARLP